MRAASEIAEQVKVVLTETKAPVHNHGPSLRCTFSAVYYSAYSSDFIENHKIGSGLAVPQGHYVLVGAGFGPLRTG